MAIDKMLAEKAARERYVVLEKDINEVKKKEKMETESMLQNMKVKIDEINEKIKKIKGDQNVERLVIEEVGESFVRMTIDYESAEISPDVKEKLKVQLDRVETEKAKWLEKYLSKKKDLKALIRKKDELVNHMEITNKYLGSYQWEVKRKEKEAMVNLVLECEQEEAELKEKKWLERQVSIVSNTTEHYQTLSSINYFHL